MGFIENNLNTHHWFNYQKFYDMVSKKGYKNLVEVGVWKGHSIIYLAKLLDDDVVTIHAVDLWNNTYKYEDGPLNEQKQHVLEIFRENVKQAKLSNEIVEIQKTSWDAAENFSDYSLDFVFIDADHSYDSVIKDIKNWLPKVKSGGMISGHDYNNPCGVKQAVDEFFGSKVQIFDGCWYVEIR
jgi:predicted O-methyltransferase YrrM